MKRLTGLILALTLLLTACGSPAGPEQVTATARLYYETRNVEELSNTEAVRFEEREMGVSTLEDFLETYFRGPLEEDLVSPFPQGTRALRVSEDEDGLVLTLSGEFFTVTGVDLSVAACCLANTVCGYSGEERFYVVDELERVRIAISPEDYLLINDFSQDANLNFALYFADGSYRGLTAETREVTLSENEAPFTYVLRELISGPESRELEPVMPRGTAVLGATTMDGVCEVSFNEAFFQPEDPLQIYTAIYGVVNSLTALEGISSVRFLKNGEPVERFGPFLLSDPLTRYTPAIRSSGTTGGELEVNAFVLRTDTMEKLSLPMRIRQTISEPLSEAVVQMVLTLEPPPGLINPVPYGTELLNISVSGGTCYLDLSRHFIPLEDTPEAEQQAVWALVSALTDLENISAVVLTIEGDSSGLSFVDISQPFTAEDAADF